MTGYSVGGVCAGLLFWCQNYAHQSIAGIIILLMSLGLASRISGLLAQKSKAESSNALVSIILAPEEQFRTHTPNCIAFGKHYYISTILISQRSLHYLVCDIVPIFNSQYAQFVVYRMTWYDILISSQS